MTQLHASLFLDPAEKIAADDTVSPGGHCTLRYGSLTLHFNAEQLPARIAELQAVVLALRNVVDDIIADDKANPPPDYETLTVADLTVGRHIQRCGVDPVGRWLTVLGIEAHPHLPGAVLIDLDGDMCATLNERDAVRVMVGGEDEPGVGDVPVGETAEVA